MTQLNGLEPIWVRVDEAMRLVSVGHSQLYEWIADGTVESIKVGRKRLISYASLKTLGQTAEAAAA